MSNKTLKDLECIGFTKVAEWKCGDNSLDYEDTGTQNLGRHLKIPKALYAFCSDKVVKYIGKTTRSIEKRFVGYKTRGRTSKLTGNATRKSKKYSVTKKKWRYWYLLRPHFCNGRVTM